MTYGRPTIAGRDHGYLFDRRHIGRDLREEWGIPEAADDDDSLVTCVRRFGRPKQTGGERRNRRPEHITGARMSGSNGHEVLLSFSGDGVYLYSTYDDPESEESAHSSPAPLLPSNAKRRRIDDVDTEARKASDPRAMDVDEDHPSPVMDIDSNATEPSENRSNEEHEDDDENEEDDDEEGSFLEIVGVNEANEEDCYPGIPVVYPRRRYTGARNVATIKDVSFFGPNDEFIASGSDDGNFFVWHKDSGVLRGIYEGDGAVVNMVEGHPHLPLVAVSGIDTTIKLFAPTNGPSQFSRLENSAHIMEVNARQSRTIRYSFAALLAEARLAMGADSAATPECRNQ
ncbi:hypothetical protein DXG03_000379 [Asterophora parasitica]|uniref:WD40 repeat-like protein n=1 Tax=Asterophora parasitica TaxID=117018 RepID=A0A9P7GKM0_9AGAR|nr:hypothetical protein DXG03_000379 [Asterophora parasitica]